MAIATWKDLCIDAVDRESQARFWAAVSGLELHVSTRNVSLDGPTEQHTVWVNGVDRPHVVKNRTHLDVDCASVEDLLALGATLLTPAGEAFHWNLMADPEGNEFCAFVRDPARVPAYRLHGIGVDCVDAAAQAAWWGEVLGAEPVNEPGHDWHTLEGVAADDRMTLDFAPVPEPRTVPNRLHWDLWGDPADFLERGATHLWAGEGFSALADPEGNEFFVVTPR